MNNFLRTLAICGLVASGQTPSQDPAQPAQPTFRSAVDLVPVDVNILDREGKPLPDLQASDFVLEVDGRPRRVASVQYVPSVRESKPAADTPTYYSSNDRAGGGRMIMFVFDQGNIGVGRGRDALESASKFIAQLSPADRIGLTTLPGAGPQIDFTEHHALVRTMLSKMSGQESAGATMYNIGLAEAAEIHRGNQMMSGEVITRECAGMRGFELDVCRRQISSEAQTLYAMARERSRNSLVGLRRLLERLALTPSQKTIIYFSEGLVVDRDVADVDWIAEVAARSQAVLYILQLHPATYDVSVARLSPTGTQDRVLAEEGLGMLAGATRGALMRVVGNAEGAFKRLSLELSGYYILSFEPEPGDRDGKRHKISVAVPAKPNTSVRARKEFIIGDTRVRSASQMLSETLNAPLLESEIPLKLSTYTLREPSTNRFKVLFAAEIDRSANPNETLSLAYVMVDAKGTVVGSRLVENVTMPMQAETRAQNYVAWIPVDASGLYTLKFAAVDERGRRGSVEHRFRAQLSSVGQVRVTDLLLGERTSDAPDSVQPSVTGEMSSNVLQGYVELYSDDEAILKDTTVALEVATSEEGRTLDAAQARLGAALTEFPNRRTAEATVPIALLPPGDYVARAVINVSGRKVGHVIRPFRVSKTKAAHTFVSRGAGSRPVIPFVSRPERFERSSVLSPEVVGFFMERMNFGPGGAPGGAAVIEHARDGRYQEAIEALASAENAQLARVFLSGLSLYAKGQLEAAAQKFRESLRLDSEFFPAAFYLGSCYAAGGRDDQAVGAWQTSLVTESNAPFIYTLLADAFLRLRDNESALGILNEARTLWPDSEQVELRLGTALASAGRGAEALGFLEPYLARHPTDLDRHFIVLRIIYEARKSGGAIRTPGEDKALFAKHAAAYQEAGGPQVALVEEWRKIVAK
jgi:VWFA-related protein